MPQALSRDQRDALHTQATADLSEIGDIYLAFENDADVTTGPEA